MKLRLLMYFFYRLFLFTAWRFHEFKEKMTEKDIILVMKAKDKKIARTYIFNAGRLSSHSGEMVVADCKLIWLSAREGGSVMAAVARGDSKALMDAIIDGQLLLEGDAVAVTWYMALVNMFGKMYREKK